MTYRQPKDDNVFIRRGPASELESKNPTLRMGEPGWDYTHNILKIGDGMTPWNDLPAISGTGEPGPPGDPGQDGEPGPPGTSGLSMIERSFASPLDSWLWTHNLDTYAVEVLTFESDGKTTKQSLPVLVDSNTVQLDWYYPESGVVRLLY